MNGEVELSLEPTETVKIKQMFTDPMDIFGIFKPILSDLPLIAVSGNNFNLYDKPITIWG